MVNVGASTAVWIMHMSIDIAVGNAHGCCTWVLAIMIMLLSCASIVARNMHKSWQRVTKLQSCYKVSFLYIYSLLEQHLVMF